jgi:hypothetical protein
LEQALGTFSLSPLWSNVTACLPEGRSLSDVVSIREISGTATSTNVEKITVRQTLRTLGARCQNQTLVDSTGQEIHFYQLDGCWGNPPIDAQAAMQLQAENIRQLRETYTVIEMTCNPSGLPIP